MTYRRPRKCGRCGEVVGHDHNECPGCRTGRFLQGVTLRVE